jgi:hypothetical protein
MSFKRILKSNYNFNPILNNRFILYFICFLALVDILYFLNIGDIKSFLVFISTGFLTTFYNKNMIVVLVLALCITHVYKYGSSAYSNKYDSSAYSNKYSNYEGLENMDTSNEEDEQERDGDGDGDVIENMDTQNNENQDNENQDNENQDNEKQKKDLIDLKLGYKEFQEIQKGIVESLSDIEPKLVKAENFIKSYEQYKSKIEDDVN